MAAAGRHLLNGLSFLPVATTDLDNLPYSKLSKLTLHFVVKRFDDYAFTFDLCELPREPGISSAAELLSMCGEFLEKVTLANAGVPPVGCSYDAAPCNGKVNAFFVGLASEEELAKHMFFRYCSTTRIAALFYPYGFLSYQKEASRRFIMASQLGAYHTQKRFSLQAVAGSKKLRWGDFWVDLSPMIRCGLGSRAFSCNDVMSDKEGVSRLSTIFMPKSWDSFGAHLHAFVCALFICGTTASPRFPRKVILFNLLACHYMVLLNVQHAKAKFGAAWQSHFLALQTVRNLSTLCAGGVNQCFIPRLEPVCCQELAIETHFSRIKQAFRGQPSIRDSIYGTVMSHLRTAKALKQAKEFGKRVRPSERDAVTVEGPSDCQSGARSCLPVPGLHLRRPICRESVRGLARVVG